MSQEERKCLICGLFPGLNFLGQAILTTRPVTLVFSGYITVIMDSLVNNFYMKERDEELETNF